MNIYGGTTMHVLDKKYITPEYYRIFRLQAGAHQWHTSVEAWKDEAAAMRQTNTFLTHIRDHVLATYALIEDVRIKVGDRSPGMYGKVMVSEFILVGKINGWNEVIAKVCVSAGGLEDVRHWNVLERQQWHVTGMRDSA